MGDALLNGEPLSHCLVSQGLTVFSAINSEDALAKLAQIPIDLILMTVIQDGLDEFTICKRIKQNAKTSDIPMLFMTTLTSEEHKIKALTMGAVDYIIHPVQLAELIARINIHLQLRSTIQSLKIEVDRHNQTVKKLEAANHALSRLANLDGLTQVANRYCFDELLSEEWFRLARDRKPIGIVLCDVDHFKVYNDHYGHQAGDECLRKIARAIHKSARRPADLVARYGGEEFVALLPGTGTEGVKSVSANICAAIRNLKLPHAQSASSTVVTISVGGCSLVPDGSMLPNTLVDLADQALYKAKSQGRNQFVLAAPVTGSGFQHQSRSFWPNTTGETDSVNKE